MALTREVLELEVYNEDELFDESSEEEGGGGDDQTNGGGGGGVGERDDQEVNKHL